MGVYVCRFEIKLILLKNCQEYASLQPGYGRRFRATPILKSKISHALWGHFFTKLTRLGRQVHIQIFLHNSKEIPSQMSTRGKYVINIGQHLVNVVKERPLGCSYSSSSSASLSCSTVLLSVPRAKRENFFLHNVAMGIKYLKNMLNGVYYYRRKRRTQAISERAPIMRRYYCIELHDCCSYSTVL